jgi:glucose dehydrogenase
MAGEAVAIVGSGFAGALIANELGKGLRSVIILEAGVGIPPNINEYMKRFYSATFKVPESPYTPEIFGGDGKLSDPSTVPAGRPTVMSPGATRGVQWTQVQGVAVVRRAI